MICYTFVILSVHPLSSYVLFLSPLVSISCLHLPICSILDVSIDLSSAGYNNRECLIEKHELKVLTACFSEKSRVFFLDVFLFYKTGTYVYFMYWVYAST